MNKTVEEKPIENDSSVEQSSNKKDHKEPSFIDVVKSVFAAMIGVQSDANRERDFAKGKASNYIIGGVIFVIIFVLVLFKIVGSVIESSVS